MHNLCFSKGELLELSAIKINDMFYDMIINLNKIIEENDNG